MNFADKIITFLAAIPKYIISGFSTLFELLAKPLSYLFFFLDGIFYFIMQLFDVVVKVVMIFVAMFQFIFAIIAGLFRVLKGLLYPTFDQPTNLPSTSRSGLNVVLDLVDPIGILDIVPYILVAFVWFFFILKILALLGGNVTAKGGS